MEKISLSDRPHKNPLVVSRIVNNETPLETEAVLVNPGKGQVKVINELGARIWQLIDGQRTVSDIIGEICTEYSVEATQAESDIANFLSLMVEKDLILINPSN